MKRASKKMSGKLIVIEGADGSGKATQAMLLADALKSKGQRVETISFPRYSNSFYGSLVGRFLAGEFGSLESISPYFASLPYALDRLDARDTLLKWLREGSHVVVDRYVPSSLAHQAAKVDAGKRAELIGWIEKMEYEENKLPRPDLVVYLHVPARQALLLIKKRDSERKDKPAMDIAETISHQIKAEEMFLTLAREKEWKKIACMDGDTMRPVHAIHTELLQIVEQSLKQLS